MAFIGAIHLQGRISSTRPEESLPPSTHGDTKDSDTDMATLIPGRIGDTLDSVPVRKMFIYIAAHRVFLSIFFGFSLSSLGFSFSFFVF